MLAPPIENERDVCPARQPLTSVASVKRTYQRGDRLSRHLKTHENARRYLCPHCHKSFNRADLLSRHVTTHNRHNAGSGPAHLAIQRTDRAGQACVPCATAKAPCEDQKPCGRCQTKNITCDVARPSLGAQRQPANVDGGRGSQSGSEAPNSNTTPLQRPENALSQQRQQQQQQRQTQQQDEIEDELQNQHPRHPVENPALSEQQLGVLNSDADHHSPSYANQLANDNAATDHEVARSAFEHPLMDPLEIYDVYSMPLDDNQLIFDNIMNEILFRPNAANFNNQNLDVNFYDFNFQEYQLDPCLTSSMDNNNHDSNEAAVVEMPDRAPRPTRDVRAGYAAFTRSPWLWTPAHHDCALRDEENLTLDEGSISSALTPRSLALTPNVPSCGFPTFRPEVRDKMYYLVSTMNKYTTRIPGFPSLDMLNHVVEAFFVRQTYQVDNWIHVPSIELSNILPELGLAFVIAGTTVISVPAIWKMGLVLQDVVRIKLGELVRVIVADCCIVLITCVVGAR